uniref:Uncharacterized protein n=1 Tax=Pinguiococcus pyrenoidosus TaxID=172671 RepID=A0A6U0WJ35_9STRA
MELAAPESVLEAAMRRDAAALQRLLSVAGVRVNERDASGRTALLWCCEYSEGFGRGRGRFKWAAGAEEKPEKAEDVEDGPGPFERCVEALLAHGADPTVEDNHGSSAVLLASFRNSLYSLNCLLAAGDGPLRRKLEALIEKPTKDGRTPLMWAVATGSKACARRLLDLGADVQRVDHMEVSSLMLASYEEGPNSSDEVDMRDAEDEEAETLVQLLLRHGASVEASDCNGRTPLFYAIMGASRNAAFELLEEGAHVSIHDEHGVTPLLLAVDMGDEDMVRLLVSSGAEVDAPDAQGRTPLAWACFAGFASNARLLLEAGANPTLQDSRGMSPLMLAAFKANFDCVQEIVDSANDEMLGILLRQESKDVRSPLLWAAASVANQQAASSVIRLLLNAGADKQKATGQGSTALLLAAHKGNTAGAIELIAHGANLFDHDEAGRNALHRAVLSGRIDTVAAIVAAGGAALLHEEDKSGRTPTFLAAQTHHAAAIAEYLREVEEAAQRDGVQSIDSLESSTESA